MASKVKAHVLGLDMKYSDHKGIVQDLMLELKYDNADRAIMISTSKVFIPNKPEPKFNTIDDLLKAPRPEPKPSEMARHTLVFYNEQATVSFEPDIKKYNEELKKERIVLRQTKWRLASSKVRADAAKFQSRMTAFTILCIAAGLGTLLLVAAIAIPKILDK